MTKCPEGRGRKPSPAALQFLPRATAIAGELRLAGEGLRLPQNVSGVIQRLLNALALALIGISVHTRQYQYVCLAAVLSAPAFFWIAGYPIFHFVPALFPLLLLISGYFLKQGKIPMAFFTMAIPFVFIFASVVFYRIFPVN